MQFEVYTTAILQECKINMGEIKPYFFLKYTLFFSALLSRSKPFQFVRNNTVKMLSQVITNNGKIIIKRDTYLQIVTQCNICTNVKVFFCALRKIYKQTLQGLKKHLLSGNNVHCSKNEKKVPAFPIFIFLVQIR